MPGTLEGGRKAAATNKKRHGADFYTRIGGKGGRSGHTGGFAADPELAKIAGRKGGMISRKGTPDKTLRERRYEYEKEYELANAIAAMEVAND